MGCIVPIDPLLWPLRESWIAPSFRWVASGTNGFDHIHTDLSFRPQFEVNTALEGGKTILLVHEEVRCLQHAVFLL